MESENNLATYNISCWDFILFLRFYLFIHERHRERERGRDTGRGRSRIHARSPRQESISGLQDHALSQREAPYCSATQGYPSFLLLMWSVCFFPFRKTHYTIWVNEESWYMAHSNLLGFWISSPTLTTFWLCWRPPLQTRQIPAYGTWFLFLLLCFL